MDETEELLTVESFNTPEMYAKEAQQVFLRNATKVAQEIVNLALKGSTDKVRLDAGRYVVDRVLGRIDVRVPTKDADGKEPWSDLFGAVIREPTADERSRGKAPH